jgi:FkbM family methyltransferase
MGAAAATARAMHLLHQGICLPDYEKLLEQGYCQLIEPGSIVFDVGAHTGRHLARFVQLVGPLGRVFAFEPLPALAQRLKRRYDNNPCVTVNVFALSNRSGHGTFRVVENGLGISGLKLREDSTDATIISFPRGRLVGGMLRRVIKLRLLGGNSIGEWAMNRGWVMVRDFPIVLDTIDAQAASLERLDFIKIDIEGAELDCLRGAGATVARHRPFISIEYGRSCYSMYGETAVSLFNWACEKDYLLSDLFGNIVEDEAEWLRVCDVSFWDYYLLPKERRDFWRSRFVS